MFIKLFINKSLLINNNKYYHTYNNLYSRSFSKFSSSSTTSSSSSSSSSSIHTSISSTSIPIPSSTSIHTTSSNTSLSTMSYNHLPLKIQHIITTLNHYYPKPEAPLNSKNSFCFLVSVVLSAQTTDGKVNEVTKILFNIADTPEKMSKLSPDEVEKIIKPVGLAPKKAINIVELSKKLVNDFNSIIPSSYEELEGLPGVGRKTASVVRSQLFNIPSFAVDTHIHRLALRWNLIKNKDEKNVNKVQEELCHIFPEELWNKLHLQMIYFGREYCSAKLHENKNCPICSWIHKNPIPEKLEIDYSSFPPQKKTKGVVFYSDRLDELTNDPSLLDFTSSATSVTSSSSTSNDIINTKEEKQPKKVAKKDIKKEKNDENLTTNTIKKENKRKNKSDINENNKDNIKNEDINDELNLKRPRTRSQTKQIQ